MGNSFITMTNLATSGALNEKSGKKRIKQSAQNDSTLLVARKGRFAWPYFLLFLIGICFLLIMNRDKFNFNSVASPQNTASQVSTLVSQETLNELLHLPPAELNCDIALMDLLCAQGLPRSETINIPDCLEKLDQWTAHVQSETERSLHKFRENPSEFYNSEGYFRMLIMAVVMYEDFGIRYNPDRITLPGQIDPNDRFFANAQDIFLNGLIEGKRMGTCSSMPVLYIAIGERLGYVRRGTPHP